MTFGLCSISDDFMPTTFPLRIKHLEFNDILKIFSLVQPSHPSLFCVCGCGKYLPSVARGSKENSDANSVLTSLFDSEHKYDNFYILGDQMNKHRGKK